MALEKVVSIDRIEVLGYGAVHVRTKTAVIEDEKELSASFHRHVVMPGDDYSSEDERVQAICSVTHTPEVIASYKSAIEKSK